MGKNLTNIFITKANGSRVPIANRRTATDISSAKQNWALNAEDTVSITVVSPFPQTYGIGDKITIFGRDYKLNRLPKVKKTGMHEFQYDLEFEGIQYDLFRVTYDVTIDTTTNELQDVQGDTLTGDLHRFMTVLVANANRVFPGKWVLGVCPETAGDKTLTFGESDNCLSVLQNLCGESNFNVEFEIEQSNGVYTINLYEKVGQTLPYTFQYGRGRGLYELTRENVSSANIVTRLKVYGSTENITSKYRADRLCLPGKTKGQSYIEKAEMVAKYGIFEGRKNFDDIKPSFTGTVDAIVSGNVLQFIDNDFPFNLNEKEADGVTTKYMIADVKPKIHFNTGNLAGYEFEVHSYDHATHTFTLIKQTDDRGNVFPSETSLAYQIGVGNEYKILDIAYPQSIEQAAEEELEETGNKYYDQNCQPKVQYGLSVTKAWLQNLVGSDETVTNVFRPGDYLHIVDKDIDVDKSVRIQSLERNILDPYEYTLTISDTVKTSVTNRVISDLIDIDKVITINNLKDPVRARANWRTSRELLNMVFDPDGDYYSDKIKPLSIDTLALSVGAKSMQFGLTNTVFQPNYGGNSNVVKWQGGVLTHYTINEETAVSWVMADGSITLSKNQAYFLYAKCAKNGDAGTFIFSTSQIKVEQDANYYHFLIGTISSIDPELKVRSLSLTYGFSMINGRFIKTGRIESADGTTYFDLDNSEIGGRIVFNSNGQEKTLEELGNEALESKNFINNTLPGLLAEIQAQLDGQIEQFFETYNPTLNNAPASEWTTTQLKDNHLGDLFYNTATGAVFRFVKENGVYKWSELSDAEVAQAIALANDALSLAKEKNRIFTATPYTPYEVGDLWVQGATGDIMRCIRTRLSGNYSSSDWQKASKYTDNTALNNFINGTYSDDIADLTTQIDGKIETWFQTTDPAASWTTTALKKKHVGDMWYNSNTRTLKAYREIRLQGTGGLISISYQWQSVENQTAIDAYEAASKAQDTADGKRRVFVSTPYPPYDIGDLWVNGTDLKRCAVKRTSGSYIATDWVKAVSYDNTKTVIDGGLVTSGTIQVAGSTSTILAGMTGQGTAASSVRFWAGTSFENRASAPFRVMQDGSVVMSKANVTGVVNATSGSIGGFNISSGKIGYGSSSEMDTTYGLALLRNYIRFYNGSQRVLLGCLSSLGYPYNGLMELIGNMGTTLELHHKYARTSDESSYETWYRPKALAIFGNQFNVGKVAMFEKGYIGTAWTDSITSYIGVTHKFLFTGTGTSYIGIDLPTKADIDNLTSNAVVQFDIEIVCDRTMPNRICIYSKSGAYIYDNNGKTCANFDMARGDVLRLRYYNGGWNLLEYRT